MHVLDKAEQNCDTKCFPHRWKSKVDRVLHFKIVDGDNKTMNTKDKIIKEI